MRWLIACILSTHPSNQPHCQLTIGSNIIIFVFFNAYLKPFMTYFLINNFLNSFTCLHLRGLHLPLLVRLLLLCTVFCTFLLFCSQTSAPSSSVFLLLIPDAWSLSIGYSLFHLLSYLIISIRAVRFPNTNSTGSRLVLNECNEHFKLLCYPFLLFSTSTVWQNWRFVGLWIKLTVQKDRIGIKKCNFTLSWSTMMQSSSDLNHPWTMDNVLSVTALLVTRYYSQLLSSVILRGN